MSERKIAYSVRDFAGLREEIVNYIKNYYPDVVKNFNDSSILSVLIDINAGIADNLHYHIDRSAQETFLSSATQRSSLFNLAKTYGFKIPGNRPSMAICDFTINVPVRGDKEDTRYLGILKAGTKIIGGGQVFELTEDVDFSTSVSNLGIPNRLKIPIFNQAGTIVSYNIIKREIVYNGETKIFSKTITQNDVRPFYEITLGEQNVLDIVSVITKETGFSAILPTDSEFFDENLRWYEVDSLADNKVFVDTGIKDNDGYKKGKYIETNKKFTKEYTANNFCVLTFGGSTSENDVISEYMLNEYGITSNNILNSFALGTSLKPNTTIFIKYRVGGGEQSILNQGALNSLAFVNFVLDDTLPLANNVRTSLSVNNITSTFGGANPPSDEEVRKYITYNFASQNRAVTLNDYEVIIKKIPGKYAAPSKISVNLDQNKVNINILGFDTNGSLTDVVSSTMMDNIADYLENYRMLNDYIVIAPAQIIDLGVECEVFTSKNYQTTEIALNINNKIKDFFNINNMQLGNNVYITNLIREILAVPGVINLINLKFYNKTSTGYSSTIPSQGVDQDGVINIIENTLFANKNQIYNLRFPEKDIKIIVR